MMAGRWPAFLLGDFRQWAELPAGQTRVADTQVVESRISKIIEGAVTELGFRLVRVRYSGAKGGRRCVATALFLAVWTELAHSSWASSLTCAYQAVEAAAAGAPGVTQSRAVGEFRHPIIISYYEDMMHQTSGDYLPYLQLQLM